MKAVSLYGVLLVILCGCAPQKRLAERLKGADRVVFSSNVPGYEDLKSTFTNEEVNDVIQAIAGSQRISPNVSCTPESRLEFFKGSTQLATITNCVSVFWLEQKPYEDKSRTFEKLAKKRREEYDERRAKEAR